ncbi:two-component system response regulator NarL [Endozoicomonas sp. SM1973]|uniref:Two-component system response regulator NarL n=1 Tax=Spartinivicinus marinus TaxID=2994442 RepID=A0A853IEX1_9GAMM|nr:two-component system response regulator NarL [Spartinivicinus marinus]MCX4025304.1 two-component system response regulator NarL [Spartinivicinus marinus]NYZ66026.1 two-component system response regulator NarL [Spartinivicinus marinus]
MSTSVVNDIIIIDDHPMLRKGLIQLLELEGDFNPVAECGDGSQAVALALQYEPDLILLDLNMPGMSGIETLKALREAEVDARILMFTVSDDQQDVMEAFKWGADGYLLKDMEPEKVVEQLRQALTGQMAISPELAVILASAIRHKTTARKASIDELTSREKQVLKLIAEGQSNKLIARKLKISEGTVKVHVKRVLNKLNMKSRVEAAVWVVENRIS